MYVYIHIYEYVYMYVYMLHFKSYTCATVPFLSGLINVKKILCKLLIFAQCYLEKAFHT